MKEVNIGAEDILWKWYRKRYEITGQQVPVPKNLCPYVWTAIWGLVLFVRHEMALRYLWWPTILSLVIICVCVGQTHLFAYVVVNIAALVAMFFGNAATIISFLRGYDFLQRKIPWLLPVFALCLVVAFVGYYAWHGDLSIHLWEMVRRTTLLVGLYLGVVIGLVALCLVIVWFMSFIPVSYTNRFKKMCQDVVTFSTARRQSICPPVNPPAGFDKT